MADALTLTHLRAIAERAGLSLADDELERLLPGVNRSWRQVAELRQLIDFADEPPAVFNPSRTQ
jgi:hypothetical protein